MSHRSSRSHHRSVLTPSLDWVPHGERGSVSARCELYQVVIQSFDVHLQALCT